MTEAAVEKCVANESAKRGHVGGAESAVPQSFPRSDDLSGDRHQVDIGERAENQLKNEAQADQ